MIITSVPLCSLSFSTAPITAVLLPSKMWHFPTQGCLFPLFPPPAPPACRCIKKGTSPPHCLENRLGKTRCEVAEVLGSVYWARTLCSPWGMWLLLPQVPEGERSLLLEAFYNNQIKQHVLDCLGRAAGLGWPEKLKHMAGRAGHREATRLQGALPALLTPALLAAFFPQ